MGQPRIEQMSQRPMMRMLNRIIWVMGITGWFSWWEASR